jgi:hypothetical protein
MNRDKNLQKLSSVEKAVPDAYIPLIRVHQTKGALTKSVKKIRLANFNLDSIIEKIRFKNSGR